MVHSSSEIQSGRIIPGAFIAFAHLSRDDAARLGARGVSPAVFGGPPKTSPRRTDAPLGVLRSRPNQSARRRLVRPGRSRSPFQLRRSGLVSCGLEMGLHCHSGSFLAAGRRVGQASRLAPINSDQGLARRRSYAPHRKRRQTPPVPPAVSAPPAPSDATRPPPRNAGAARTTPGHTAQCPRPR